MTSMFSGYLIFFAFTFFFIFVAVFINKRLPMDENVDELLTAGRKIPFGIVAVGVFTSWVWAGTIMAGAEAGIEFGVSGGMGYSIGSFVPFLIFIPIAMRLRSVMPQSTTFVEFIRERFGSKLALVFLCFSVLLVVYVSTAQAIGIAYSFQVIFGMNFMLTAFLSGLLFSLFIAIAGIRGSIYNSVFQFFIIMIIIFITLPVMIKSIGLENMYNGLFDASTNPSNPNYNPAALEFFGTSGLRFTLSFLVAGMGLVLLSQGYYSKAASAGNSRSLFWAFIVGTIVGFLPIPIIFGNVIGGGVFDLQLTTDLYSSSGAAPYIFNHFLGDFGSVAFVILIFMAGLTTGGNGLSGVQAMISIDFYKQHIHKDASEREQTKFGRRMTVVFGLIIGILAASLEGISMLKLDILSGIVFAAPLAALIVGLWSRKLNKHVAFLSVFIGLFSGIITYLAIPDDDINWFVGNVVSFLVPFAVIFIGMPFNKHRYNFNKLREYTPSHSVKVGREYVTDHSVKAVGEGEK